MIHVAMHLRASVGVSPHLDGAEIWQAFCMVTDTVRMIPNVRYTGPRAFLPCGRLYTAEILPTNCGVS